MKEKAQLRTRGTREGPIQFPPKKGEKKRLQRGEKERKGKEASETGAKEKREQ